MSLKVLIIGNGIAGIEAALNIRTQLESADISVISSCNHLLYYRPRLIEYLKGNLNLQNFTIYKPDYYQQKNIKNILSEKIVDIDIKNQKIKSINNKIFSYDKLLIATGASSFKPPLQGSNVEGVFALRSINDAKNIMEFSNDKKEIVILGGGLLGIEIAYSLKKSNNKITIVEMFDRLLPRQLDLDGANILENILNEKGLNFILNNSVSSIISDNNKVKKVKLKNGDEIPSDCIIISAGIRPNIELAKNVGIETKRGILINNNFQTSIENIYSAGDCSEHNGHVYGLWSVSKEQGKLAGLSISGKRVDYKGSIPSTTLKVTGIDLFSSGHFDSAETDKVYTKKDNKSYLKIVIKDKKIIGAIALGNKQAISDFKSVIEGRKELETIKDYFN